MAGRSAGSAASMRSSGSVREPARRGGMICPPATRCSMPSAFSSMPNGGEPSMQV
jgi:hypothetical protein